jgi:hypothetical protein
MSKEPKTPKGAMKEARKRHLNQQAASDALKRLREGLSTEVTAFGPDRKIGTFYARPLAEDEPIPGQLVLCVCGGRLRVMTAIWKDGYNVADSRQNVRLPDDQIYGVIDVRLECNNCGTRPADWGLLKPTDRAGDQCPCCFLDDYDCDGTLVEVVVRSTLEGDPNP